MMNKIENKTLEEKPKKKPGRVPFWKGDLGRNNMTSFRAPQKIIDLLHEKQFKKLMNWIALDKGFKKEIMKQVPRELPVKGS